MTLNSIRQELLSSFSARPVVKKSKGVEEPRPPPSARYGARSYTLTAAMRQVEERFNTRIEYLLRKELTGSEVSRNLNISKATVSRWRFRVGIEVK